MAKDDYVPREDPVFAALLLHVAATLPTFFNRLGIGPTTSQVMAQAADALAFDYSVRCQRILIAGGKEATAAKNRLRDGDPERPALAVNTNFPSAPGAVPTAVTPGVEARFRLFVAWLKGLAGFGDDIAEALKIVGAQLAMPDVTLAKPLLPLRVAGGHVHIDWTWRGYRRAVDGLEIQVDRGTGTFTLLTIDMRPGFEDPEPIPANSAVWKYKAIFRKNDQRVGVWSDVAAIPVG